MSSKPPAGAAMRRTPLWRSVPRLAVVLAVLGWVWFHLWDEYRKPNLRRVLRPPELEAVIRERWELDELTLTEAAPGRFIGSGRGRNGLHYDFGVEQGEGGRRIDFRYGERGEDGTIRLDSRVGGGGSVATSW